jgi:hypothetical protein
MEVQNALLPVIIRTWCKKVFDLPTRPPQPQPYVWSGDYRTRTLQCAIIHEALSTTIEWSSFSVSVSIAKAGVEARLQQ